MRTLLYISASLLSSTALADPPSAERPAPSATQQSIYRALSVRDPVPSCAQLEAMSPSPVEDLLFVVDHAAQPPWAAMRAAQCLVRLHPVEIQSQIEAWVSQESTRGLALMTLGLIDELPFEVAHPVAIQAMQGPLAEDARPRLLKAADLEIQKLAK
jgi:hypothetical protein